MNVTRSTGLFSIRDVLPGVKCEKVICWVSSVKEADRVVEVAKSFAAIGNEPCHVVMCIDPVPKGKTSGCPVCSPLTPELICREGERLKALYGSDVFTVVLPGHPVTEIRRYALSHRADLIVVGEQGRQLEKIYGEQLIDTAPCAVLHLALPKNQSEKDSEHKELNKSISNE